MEVQAVDKERHSTFSFTQLVQQLTYRMSYDTRRVGIGGMGNN